MPGPVLSTRKRRFQRWIRRSFLVRFHMGIILLVVVLSGLASSYLLLKLGLTNMPARYGLAVGLGYGVFFLCVRLWLLYVEQTAPAEGAGHLADIGADVVTDAAVDGAYVAGEATAAIDAGGGAAADGAGGGLSIELGDGEGVIVLVVLGLLLIVFFGVGVYLIYQAPVILSEAAGQLLLAAALRRRTKLLDTPGWSGSVLRATWIPALIVLAMALAAGFALQAICPEATKIAEALELCVFSE